MQGGVCVEGGGGKGVKELTMWNLLFQVDLEEMV